MLDIIDAPAVRNLCYITARKMTPRGIVVHSTGANNPYLKRYVDAPDAVGRNLYGNHWNTAKPGGRCVCVHAFIGYDRDKRVRVAEILPRDICCWGVGAGKHGSYNYDPAYIQFEICEDGLDDRAYYQSAFAVAAEYCAELCRVYGISCSNIVGHCEAYRLGYGSNHADPEHWMKKFGESMQDFRERVSALCKDGGPLPDDAADSLPYLVKVRCDNLAIYQDAGIDSPQVAAITDQGVYTIVEEKSDAGAGMWGRLKSGAGWISLEQTEKLHTQKSERICMSTSAPSGKAG